MTITITVPDSLAKKAEARAAASGSSVEKFVLATLAESLDRESAEQVPPTEVNRESSPLLKLIGLVKNGRTDASVNHDIRPDDPV